MAVPLPAVHGFVSFNPTSSGLLVDDREASSALHLVEVVIVDGVDKEAGACRDVEDVTGRLKRPHGLQELGAVARVLHLLQVLKRHVDGLEERIR